jgi:hypothetical protein
MKKVKLYNYVGKDVEINYPSQSFKGKITRDETHGKFYYHLAFKSQEKKGDNIEDCVKTVFLREEDLRLGDDGNLTSNRDFCPIWTHRKYEAEYSQILKNLNEKK